MAAEAIPAPRAVYAEAAPIYVAAGWHPIPLPAGAKSPPPSGFTGEDGAIATAEQIALWQIERADGNVGLRMAPDVIGIDVDEYDNKYGTLTLRGLEDTYGALPPTWQSTSRGDGPSSIRFYKVPYGTEFPGVLGDDIDVIQHSYRYAVVAPSIHPKTGQRYRWYTPDRVAHTTAPHVDELADLPAAWVKAFAIPPAPGAATPAPPQPTSFDDDSIARRIRDDHDWHTVLTGDGWQLTKTQGNDTHWTRLGKDKREGTGAALHEPDGPFNVFTSSIKAMVQPWAWSKTHKCWSYSLFGYIAATRYNGDRSRCAREYRLEHNAANTIHHAITVLDDETGAPGLDETFWTARPYLTHIRTAARSRLVSPPALLGAVLARIAAFTPPSSCLPAIIGSTAPLSLYVALRGSSGAGKSSPAAAAADLLPNRPAGCVGPLALGSGEGLVEAFMELVEEDDSNGKKRKIKRQIHHGALFSLDEGQLLGELGSRRGATILPVLRTAWSGGDPGQANASIETRRTLRPGTYNVGLISLWQDHAAAALLADAAGGTPQRFTWFGTDDPDAGDQGIPEWPGPITWEPPALISMSGIIGRNTIDVHDNIRHEITAARLAELRGDTTTNPLDAHRRLNKLKIAGILAILDHRHNIDTDDWQLAEAIMTNSDTVRHEVLAAAVALQRQEETIGHTKAVAREAIVENAGYSRSLARAARAVANKIHRDTGTVTARDARHSIASRDRQNVTVEEALTEAQRLQWITPVDGGWTSGTAKPA